MTGPEPSDLELLRRLYAKWGVGDFDNAERRRLGLRALAPARV